jgi:predicted metal-dependent hydrolase
MTQKLCKRLEELEKISAAAQRARTSSGDRQALERLRARLEARRASPELAKLLAESSPDFLRNRMQELRAQLRERAYGHSRSAHLGGLR